MIITFRAAGTGLNVHVVWRVLYGLVRTSPEKFGRCIDFQVNQFWFRSLHRRMKVSRRAVTTSRPIITKSLWVEVRSQFLHEITQKALQYNISNKLIINADQTPSKFVAKDNITMAAQGKKHVSRRGATNKRVITVTLCESFDGIILPSQLMYTGKISLKCQFSARNLFGSQ